MKKLSLIFISIFPLLLNGCNFNHTAARNNYNSALAQPTASVIVNAQPTTNLEGDKSQDFADDEEENEITECSPQKVYLGESFKVSFKKKHGKNFAIYNEKSKDFYFLTENAPYYFPQMSPDEFEKLSFIEFDTQEVRSSSDEIGKDGYNKAKPFFDQTGWYRIIVGHQALDVDFIDMPITGSCRIYYVNKKRLSEK